MALYVKQSDTRSQLQEKLAKDLQERARQKAAEADLPDGVTDSQFIKGTTETSRHAWVWALVALAVFAVIITLIIISIQ